MLIANSLSSLSIDPRSDLGIATQIRARIAFLVADGSWPRENNFHPCAALRTS